MNSAFTNYRDFYKSIRPHRANRPVSIIGPPALPYNNMVIFGDSLSCTGKYFEIEKEKPEARHVLYNEGRYADQLLWHEYFQKMVQPLNTQNFACAWATAAPPKAGTTIKIPALDRQVSDYLEFRSSTESFHGKTLYAIWIGGNDLCTPFKVDPMVVPLIIIHEMERIIKADPSADFLIANILPGDTAPFIANASPAMKRRAADRSDSHDVVLKAMLKEFLVRLRSNDVMGTNVYYADVTHFIRILTRQPKLFQFDECLEPCIKKNDDVNTYGDPSKRIYLDNLHVASKVHQMISRYFLELILRNRTFD